MTDATPLPAPYAGDATLFRYAGALSWRGLPAVTARLKARLAAADVSAHERRTAFSAFIELAYNALQHADGASVGKDPAAGRRVPFALALGRDGGALCIAAANLVSRPRAAPLAAHLQGLDRAFGAAARELYRRRLAGAPQVADGVQNAGLGLITVARESTRPIEFALAPHQGDPGLVRFHLRAFLS